eukprot:Colp12_sorted_trinity150504_noHs@5789
MVERERGSDLVAVKDEMSNVVDVTVNAGTSLQPTSTLNSLKSNIDSSCDGWNAPPNTPCKLILHKIKTVARKGSDPGYFEDPRGIACSDGLIYVCDFYNDRIQILSEKTGEYVRMFEADQFLQPMHITVTENYIACVQSYDQEILSWISKDTFTIVASCRAPGFGGYGGVCCATGTDRVFVSLTEDDLIAELDHKNTTALRVFCYKAICSPTSIFFKSDEQLLYICCEKTVEVLDIKGGERNIVHTASYEGFSRTCGICVDPKGNSIIADAGTSNLYLFDDELRLTTSYSYANDSRKGPAGMTFDGVGRFWITHSSTSTVVKYECQIQYL